jgi:RimJ/RimL family protein N-acetyltransferase
LVYPEKIKGLLIDLRNVEIEDAEYILSLRLDESLKQFLNKVENDLEQQKAWIKKQRSKPDDYYFIIETKQGVAKGAIALYNLDNNKAEFGRWICTGNALESLESAILIYEFGFNHLNLNEVYNDTATANKKASSFHKSFGCKDRQTRIVYMPGHPLGDSFEATERYISKNDFPDLKQKHYKLINSVVK